MMTPLLGAAGDLELVGHGVGVDRQRVVARGGERVGQAGEHPVPSWCTSEVLPCSSSGARLTVAP